MFTMNDFYAGWTALTIALSIGNHEHVKMLFVLFLSHLCPTMSDQVNAFPARIVSLFLKKVFSALDESGVGNIVNLFLMSMHYDTLIFNISPHNTNRLIGGNNIEEDDDSDDVIAPIYSDSEDDSEEPTIRRTEPKRRRSSIRRRSFSKTATVKKNQYTMHEHAFHFAMKMMKKKGKKRSASGKGSKSVKRRRTI